MNRNNIYKMGCICATHSPSQSDRDTISFEEEYRVDIRNGYGTCFYRNGNKMFEGEYKDGKRNGHGISFYKNGNNVFKGEYKVGKRNGYGTIFNENGIKRYEGWWKDGKFSKGYMFDFGEYDECGWVKTDSSGKLMLHGKGAQKLTDGTILYGVFSNGVFVKEISEKEFKPPPSYAEATRSTTN